MGRSNPKYKPLDVVFNPVTNLLYLIIEPNPAIFTGTYAVKQINDKDHDLRYFRIDQIDRTFRPATKAEQVLYGNK